MRVVGVMSGTSLDGIDVAIADITGRGWSKRIVPVTHHTVPYSARLRETILSVSNREAHIAVVSRLHVLLGELYAAAILSTCKRAGLEAASLELIGCHGQTIFHEGAGSRFLGRRIASTLQIGDGAVVAERIGAPVVSDFRTRDMAAGGRGAPLVPYVDYLVFRHHRRGRVALNIGGIANITAIPAGAKSSDVLAFDTGPGNMVVDALIAGYTNGKRRFDRDGAIASRGRVSEPLLKLLLRDRFFHRRPPKTAGREQFGAEYVARLRDSGLSAEDLVATATALTATAIGLGVDRFVRPRMQVHELIVAGGGVHNPRMMAYLAAFLPDVKIKTSTEFGINVDAKEAIAFAVLAYETWRGHPSNLPSATGAARPVILGKISP